MAKKYNRIIIFDMPGKDYLPSYGALQLVSQLDSKGYEVEYCDLDEESFQLFEDREVFYDTLERFEKIIAATGWTAKKRAVAFYIKKHAKRTYKRQEKNPDESNKKLRPLFTLLIGGKNVKSSLRTDKRTEYIFNQAMFRYLNNSIYCEAFSEAFFGSSKFLEWLENKIKNKDVLCFSISYSHQNTPFRVIVNNVKAKFSEKKVIAGGQDVTRHWGAGMLNKEYLNCCDFAVFGEGEEPLVALLKHMNNNYSNKISNTICLSNKTKSYKIGYLRNLDALPLAAYSAKMVKKYNLTYLFYETSRSCTWHKCSFCAYRCIKSPYRGKSPKKIVSELKILKHNTGISNFYFVNDELALDHALEIANEIIKEDVNIKWGSFMRFDNKLSSDKLTILKQGGCSELGFGLESGDELTNKMIRKGISVNDAKAIIRRCREARINVQLFTVVGFPSESLISMLRTINFIRKNRKYLRRAKVNIFRVAPRTQMAIQQKKYGLKITNSYKGEFISYKNNFFRKCILPPLIYISHLLLSTPNFEFDWR